MVQEQGSAFLKQLRLNWEVLLEDIQKPVSRLLSVQQGM